MAGKYGPFIKEVDYGASMLPIYLRYDYWKAIDGMWLLAGLDPRKTIVGKDKLLFQPLDADEVFFQLTTYFHEYLKKLEHQVSLEEILGEKITAKDEKELLNMIAWERKKAAQRFQPFRLVWINCNEAEGREADLSWRVKVPEFIAWAKDKKLLSAVSWARWAMKEGFIEAEEIPSKTDVPLHPRRETTLLNTVAALAEIVMGDRFGPKEFSNKTELVGFITEKYSGFHGLSERKLFDTLKDAKRSLQSNP